MNKLVVNCRMEAYDVYIGRTPSYKAHLRSCPQCRERPLNLCEKGEYLLGLGNPYALPKDGSRPQVLEKFEAYARDRIRIDRFYASSVYVLQGQILGCWCAPQLCHGEVLIKLSRELHRRA